MNAPATAGRALIPGSSAELEQQTSANQFAAAGEVIRCFRMTWRTWVDYMNGYESGKSNPQGMGVMNQFHVPNKGGKLSDFPTW